MMSETKFRNQLSDRLPDFLIAKIESGLTSPGIPDTHFLLKGTNKTLFIELKFCIRKPTQIDLRPAQPPWLRKYWRNGGKCFVAVKCKRENAVYLWEGRHALELKRGDNIWSISHHKFYGVVKWKQLDDFLKKQLENN